MLFSYVSGVPGVLLLVALTIVIRKFATFYILDFFHGMQRERETAIYICLIRVPILPIKPLFHKDIHKQETMSHGLYFTLLLSFSMNWIFGIALDIVFEHLNLKLLLVIAFIFLVNT